MNLGLFRVVVRLPSQGREGVPRVAEGWSFLKLTDKPREQGAPSALTVEESMPPTCTPGKAMASTCTLEEVYSLPAGLPSEPATYQLPVEATSEAIYELVDTLPLPSREPVAARCPTPRPRRRRAHSTSTSSHSSSTSSSPGPPLPPRGRSLRAPRPPPRAPRSTSTK